MQRKRSITNAQKNCTHAIRIENIETKQLHFHCVDKPNGRHSICVQCLASFRLCCISGSPQDELCFVQNALVSSFVHGRKYSCGINNLTRIEWKIQCKHKKSCYLMVSGVLWKVCKFLVLTFFFSTRCWWKIRQTCENRKAHCHIVTLKACLPYHLSQYILRTWQNVNSNMWISVAKMQTWRISFPITIKLPSFQCLHLFLI